MRREHDVAVVSGSGQQCSGILCMIAPMTNKDSKTIDSLTRYASLGRSGLRVSPLCLGTMTFGMDFGWGSSREAANSILERYLEAGGNFIDTANFYTAGTSERIIGEYLAERRCRDEVV